MPNDENKIFDVSKPHKVPPSASAKPIIVGHHPVMNDPMVKAADEPAERESPFTPLPEPDLPEGSRPESTTGSETSSSFVPVIQSQPHEPIKTAPSPDQTAEKKEPEPDFAPIGNLPGNEPESGSMPPAYDVGAPGPPAGAVHSDLPISESPGLHWKKMLLWLVLAALLIFSGAYLAVDSGLINSNINLPLHFFGQKSRPLLSNNQPVAISPAVTPQTSQPTAPAGFTAFKQPGLPFLFNYPSAWGAPTVTSEMGFSKRGGTNKADGTYAYLVNFALNKDIQIAFTSGKYLPPARAALYYDFLGWCTNPTDSKIYKSILHFSTSAGVDTPSTVSCDQGPLTDATKLDSATIMQTKTNAADGTPLGDLYTMNIAPSVSTTFPVVRVKDSAMTNGDNIKKMLATVLFTTSTQ